MNLDIKKKDRIVHKLHNQFKQAISVVVASLDGMSASEADELRKFARDSKVDLFVTRNTLVRRAISDTSFECLRNIFIGQNIIAFSTTKPNSAARVFIKFSKDHDYFKIKGAAFEGKFISTQKIDLLSSIPDYKGAVSRLVLVMKFSSIGNMMRILRILSSRRIQ